MEVCRKLFEQGSRRRLIPVLGNYIEILNIIFLIYLQSTYFEILFKLCVNDEHYNWNTTRGKICCCFWFLVDLDKDLLWLRSITEEPDANTDTDDEGDDVGDDHGVHELVAPFGGFEDSVVAFVVRFKFPLFRRSDVGSGTPVPDEVWYRHGISFTDGVDVDSRPVLLPVVILLLIVGTVGRRLGRVVRHVGRHTTGCSTGSTVGSLSLSLSQHPHVVALTSKSNGRHCSAAENISREIHPRSSEGCWSIRHNWWWWHWH